MHPHFGSSLLVGQHAEEIFSSGPLEVLEVKNILCSRANSPKNKHTFKAPSCGFYFKHTIKKYAAICTKHDK
jgi:hypothetical protein